MPCEENWDGVRIIHRITALSYSLRMTFQLLKHDCSSERKQKKNLKPANLLYFNVNVFFLIRSQATSVSRSLSKNPSLPEACSDLANLFSKRWFNVSFGWLPPSSFMVFRYLIDNKIVGLIKSRPNF